MYTVHKLHLYTFSGRRLSIQHSHGLTLQWSAHLTTGLLLLQHIQCIYSAFDGNSASLQHQPTSPKSFDNVWCIYLLHNLDMSDRDSSSTSIFCQIEWQSQPAGRMGYIKVKHLKGCCTQTPFNKPTWS